MNVIIKRIDPSLPLPEYHTSGAAAFDFYAREEVVVNPHSIAKIATNFIIQTPNGYMLNVYARSSLAHKKGLMLSNGVGVVDSDYAGPNDEILIAVYNFTDAPVTVTQGERIAQGTFVKVEQAQWHETHEIVAPNRGGFGSTGSSI